ncbi:MAG: prolyl oligopeptidase family serine peptidase [Crocinitomicaceae bacterium]|nr:prolyl oligopeptidase family serine peptidase [Crocinitomicaceae bacterium]
MKLSHLSCLILALTTFNAFGQEKKKIDYQVYDEWKSFRSIKQSQSGDWITYQVNPSVGDAVLTIESTASDKKIVVNRGEDASIAYSESFTIFTIAPGYDTLRTLELDEVPRKKWPLDTLGVYLHKEDSISLIPDVKSFKLAEEGNWVGYMLNEDKTPECPEPKKRWLFKKKKKKNECEKPSTTGKTLVVWNPLTGDSREIHGVTSFTFDTKGKKLAYVKSLKGDSDTLSVNLTDLTNWNTIRIDDKKLKVKYPSFSEQGDQLVYLASTDTNERKNFELFSWSVGDEKANKIIDSLSSNMPKNWTVSANRRPYFSENGSRIFFGTNKIIRQEPEDTLLDSEKAKVDVWRWNDPFIQPGQLINKYFDAKQTFLAVYDINKKDMIQLADSLMESVSVQNKGNADFALGYSKLGYEMERTWTYPWRTDFFKVNMITGEREMIKEGIFGFGSISPMGDKFVWYSTLDSAWMGKDISTGKEYNLTENIEGIFSDDNNGVPYAPQEVGTEGWMLLDGIEYYVVKNRFDIWAVNPVKPGEEFCLTGGTGMKEQVSFNLVQFNTDSLYIQMEESMLYGTDEESRDGSYWSINQNGKEFTKKKLMESGHMMTYISKAKMSDKLLLRRTNFQTYGELEVTDFNFSNPKIITDINPQQVEYNWGTVETTTWKAYDGTDMRGLLYKPEDFDSTKSYPLMVYFYEKYMDRKHAYYAPRATASIIYPTEYVSNGYIVFIPDVYYEEGHPAKSAYNCIVSGSDALTRRHSWIDSTRMALQGQSWGGYQTAQLVTMTTKYKAAMAGAPVSNMFSAYGGVRWGSGYSRMFQYERGQSRIGYTIWERPDLYIENSPIFGIPNVSTPLLIMHNDDDGAVPWYQGIEMYMGLRRLSKPAWLLNYNGDKHNLTQLANKKDLSIRMRQFFDYYLLDAPMPYWMKYGVPAVDKGKTYGLELLNE